MNTSGNTGWDLTVSGVCKRIIAAPAIMIAFFIVEAPLVTLFIMMMKRTSCGSRRIVAVHNCVIEITSLLSPKPDIVSAMFLLEGADIWSVLEGHVYVIDTIQKSVLVEGLKLKRVGSPVRSGHALGLQIKRNL